MSPSDARVARLVEVLDRRVAVDAVDALVATFNRQDKSAPPLAEIGFGVDASVFLRLARRENSDIVDYLASPTRTGPLILPSQAVLEFWNNHDAYVEDVAQKIRKSFDALAKTVVDLDDRFEAFRPRAKALVDDFREEYGYVLEENTERELHGMLGALSAGATRPCAPRSELQGIAENRKRTKTPPGFKDPKDGDFYIWADFLLGLLQADAGGPSFSHVVLLTEDKKKDWSRARSAHPALVAEVRVLLDRPLEIWSLETFRRRMGANAGS